LPGGHFYPSRGPTEKRIRLWVFQGFAVAKKNDSRRGLPHWYQKMKNGNAPDFKDKNPGPPKRTHTPGTSGPVATIRPLFGSVDFFVVMRFSGLFVVVAWRVLRGNSHHSLDPSTPGQSINPGRWRVWSLIRIGLCR